jgi:hypothetical protein
LLIVQRPGSAAIAAALIAALMAIIGSASPAAAHGSQHHVPIIDAASTPASDYFQAVAGAKLGLAVHELSEQIGTRSSDERSQPSDQHDCCCGGALCHAGATLANELVVFRYLDGEKVLPPKSSRKQARFPSGLERPPRRGLPV